MEKLKTSFGVSYAALAAEAGVGYRCLMRWRRRIGKGEPPLKVPGPKKTVPFDLCQLHQDIERLSHGRKRSRGSAAFHRAHGEALSRCEIGALVRMARKHHNVHRAAECHRVRWHIPNLAWALDGSEYQSRLVTGKLHMQNLQDLCSRYKFVPLATDYPPCCEEVSGYLADQFNCFAPPLFCKRDNGAIGHAQGEMKGYLSKWDTKAGSMESLELLTEVASHDLNHQPRRVLSGRNACQWYFGKKRKRYTKRKRKAIYCWVRDLAVEISARTGRRRISTAA